ncbi:MAG: ECF transporter S component [Clostridia bacterium]|nr:ECF transporter S component [Clostridia bacterium]
MSNRKKLVLTVLITIVLIPAVIIAGLTLLGAEAYAFVISAVAVMTCVPFFIVFEHSRNDARRLMLVAVMTALSVLGRLLFAAVQFVKPVAALSIFAGMYLGPSSGFATGAFAALISNFYFGQGAWTPFQMLAWGLIGFFAGLLSKRLQKSVILLAIYGALAGVFFSLVLDVWSSMWYGGSFDLNYFLVSVSASLPFTIIYAASNVVFLVLLKRPVGSALERLGVKYGIQDVFH